MTNDPLWHYDRKTKKEILSYLKKYGRIGNKQETQNYSPSVGDFLALAKDYPTITYHGYVVEKPRDDYRVSIEGFSLIGLTVEQALEVVKTYGYADECNYKKEKDGTYTVYTWWD